MKDGRQRCRLKTEKGDVETGNQSTYEEQACGIGNDSSDYTHIGDMSEGESKGMNGGIPRRNDGLFKEKYQGK